MQIDPNFSPIKWKYFGTLFDIDRVNVHGRLCPKLTNNHIAPHDFLKMKVSFAVQVLIYFTIINYNLIIPNESYFKFFTQFE